MLNSNLVNLSPNSKIENIIYSTTDYSWFKKVEANREVNLDSGKRKELEESILKNGMIFPVLVNEDGYVYDGQHRLSICKKNNLPVSYFVMPNLTLELMRELNATPNVWSFKDYVDSYKETNPIYANISNLANKYKVNETLVVGLATGKLNNATTRNDALKLGKIIISDRCWKVVEDFLLYLLKFQGEFKLPNDHAYALFKVWTLSSIDKKRLLRLSQKIKDIWVGTNKNRFQLEIAMFDCYNNGLSNAKRVFTYQQTNKKSNRIFILGEQSKSDYEDLEIYNYYKSKV